MWSVTPGFENAKIRFNLAGISGRNEDGSPRSLYTQRELVYVLNDPALKAKTVFYDYPEQGVKELHGADYDTKFESLMDNFVSTGLAMTKYSYPIKNK